jgi:hypothetical protein
MLSGAILFWSSRALNTTGLHRAGLPIYLRSQLTRDVRGERRLADAAFLIEQCDNHCGSDRAPENIREHCACECRPSPQS